nr:MULTISPECIES: hypothetical protein [unclassified Streptomyces]
MHSPVRTTGAHRAHPVVDRGAHRTGRRPPGRYEAVLDGLFTYCLSVLCDHDTATVVLADVLAVAERHHARGPADEEGRTAWLYALARWACLRSLGEQRGRRQGAHTGRPAVTPPEPPRIPEETAERRRAELARLAWPEAAGTTPEQREALELAVRHGLDPHQVAAVLALDPVAARELLATAGCEVERTRAALAVVETGDCPTVARLTGDQRPLLSAALRAELVRHVDDCPLCRRTAERVGATSPWPGTGALPAVSLPLVEAPRAAAYLAMLHVPRARAGAPRFAPTGFPMAPKDHVARRGRLRARAVTTTVVAAVVAAPVLALWTSYRSAPGADRTGAEGHRISAREADGPAVTGRHPYRDADDAHDRPGGGRTGPDPRFTRASRAPGLSVEVLSPGGPTGPTATSRPDGPATGWIIADARSQNGLTLLTLTAGGRAPVAWSLWTDAPWLYVSRASGTLRPGATVTVAVRVDRAREPRDAWSARLGVNPSGAVIRIHGQGEPVPQADPPVLPYALRPPRPTGPPAAAARPTRPAKPSTAEPTAPPTTRPADPATPPTSPPPAEADTPPPASEQPPPTTPAPAPALATPEPTPSMTEEPHPTSS